MPSEIAEIALVLRSALIGAARQAQSMDEPRFTPYFENVVLRRRPYLKREWCAFVLRNAVHCEPQDGNRYRFWAAIPELQGRYLRVVTLGDMVTVHNAFPDRRFRP